MYNCVHAYWWTNLLSSVGNEKFAIWQIKHFLDHVQHYSGTFMALKNPYFANGVFRIEINLELTDTSYPYSFFVSAVFYSNTFFVGWAVVAFQISANTGTHAQPQTAFWEEQTCLLYLLQRQNRYQGRIIYILRYRKRWKHDAKNMKIIFKLLKSITRRK